MLWSGFYSKPTAQMAERESYTYQINESGLGWKKIKNVFLQKK